MFHVNVQNIADSENVTLPRCLHRLAFASVLFVHHHGRNEQREISGDRFLFVAARLFEGKNFSYFCRLPSCHYVAVSHEPEELELETFDFFRACTPIVLQCNLEFFARPDTVLPNDHLGRAFFASHANYAASRVRHRLFKQDFRRLSNERPVHEYFPPAPVKRYIFELAWEAGVSPHVSRVLRDKLSPDYVFNPELIDKI